MFSSGCPSSIDSYVPQPSTSDNWNFWISGVVPLGPGDTMSADTFTYQLLDSISQLSLKTFVLNVWSLAAFQLSERYHGRVPPSRGPCPCSSKLGQVFLNLVADTACHKTHWIGVLSRPVYSSIGFQSA